MSNNNCKDKRVPVSGMVIFFILCGAFTAVGAEYSLKPSISVSEEYTDNANGESARQRTDFITSTNSKLGLNYKTRSWDWDASYKLSYFNYAMGSSDDNFTNTVSAVGKMQLVDNHLFLDINESYDQVALFKVQNEGQSNNQTNQNNLKINPYFKFMPTASTEVTTGYRFISRLNSGVDGLDNQEQQAYVGATKELTPKWYLQGNFDYARVMPDTVDKHNRYTVSTGLKTYYFTESFITVKGGYSWFRFDNGSNRAYPYWDVKIIHAFAPWSATLGTVTSYNSNILHSSSESRRFEGSLRRASTRTTMQLDAALIYTRDTEKDVQLSDETRLSVRATHLFTEKLAGHASIKAAKILGYDAVTKSYTGETPYQFIIGSGISYVLSGLKVSLDYEYETDRHTPVSTTNSINTNRVLLTVSKAFQELVF